jgi:DNA-binding transcriptional LysR family regulator
LLRKRGRGLAPTEAGEALLSYARRLLELNDEAVAALRGAEVEGWVRLGLPQDFAEPWLPEVLGRLARRHPRLRVEVRVERGSELLERIGDGGLDLALTWSEPQGAHAERLAELPVEWIGSASREPLWPSGEPLPLVAFEPPCRFRDMGAAALDRAGVPWRLAFTSPSLAGLWAAVAAGLGVSPRTRAGLPGGLRALGPAEAGLPALPRIALSLHLGEARPEPAVELIASLLRETLVGSLASAQAA